MTKKIYKQSRLWLDGKRDVRTTSKVVFGWMKKRFKNNKQSRLWLDGKRDLRTTSKVVFGWMTKEI
jgi:hypothetical protein